jgi:hypothetical protein
MHSPTSHILHFSCLSISSSSKQRIIPILWRNETTIFEFTMNPQITECRLYLSYDAQVCLRLQKGQYSLSDAMDGLGTEEGNNEYSLYSLPWKTMFSLFCPLVKRLAYLKGVTKTWNLPAENYITLLLSAVLWHSECENISNFTSRSDFIMQNYYVKKLEVIFTVHIKIKSSL